MRIFEIVHLSVGRGFLSTAINLARIAPAGFPKRMLPKPSNLSDEPSRLNMRLIRSPFVTGLGACGILAAACLTLTTMAQGTFGLAGDTIRGKLSVPGLPFEGNYFTQNDAGYPTSNVPSFAVVGSGIEFGYYPKQVSTYTWRLNVDVSDNQITIKETLSDPSPEYWEGGFTGWVLTLSDLDWAGAAGIGGVNYVSHDSQIDVNRFDAHLIQFGIDSITVHPTGPYSISRTTIVQLTAVPEPSAALLILCGLAAVLWRKRSLSLFPFASRTTKTTRART